MRTREVKPSMASTALTLAHVSPSLSDVTLGFSQGFLLMIRFYGQLGMRNLTSACQGSGELSL